MRHLHEESAYVSETFIHSLGLNKNMNDTEGEGKEREREQGNSLLMPHLPVVIITPVTQTSSEVAH